MARKLAALRSFVYLCRENIIERILLLPFLLQTTAGFQIFISRGSQALMQARTQNPGRQT